MSNVRADDSTTINRRGMAWMVVAMSCYALNDACVKQAASTLPVAQLLLIRAGFSLTMLCAVLRFAHGRSDARRSEKNSGIAQLTHPLVLLKCVLEVLAALTSALAVWLLPLHVATTLTMTAPLLIVVTSMVAGWEKRSFDRLVAAVVGFAGALLVAVRPVGADLTWQGVAAALACAAAIAARDLSSRTLPASLDSVMVAFATTAAIGLASGVWMLGRTWTPIGASEIRVLAAAAAFSAVGNLALIVACRRSDLSVVSPFRYTIVFWALMLSYVVWGERPSVRSLVGVVLIAAAGSYSLRRRSRGELTEG